MCTMKDVSTWSRCEHSYDSSLQMRRTDRCSHSARQNGPLFDSVGCSWLWMPSSMVDDVRMHGLLLFD